MGMGTRYIGIVERSPGLLRITIRQDGTSNHYTQQVPQGDIIDPEKRDVRLRCLRVGRAVKLLWQRNFFNYSSHALLNDDIDDEWEDGLEWMTMKKRRQ